MGVPESRAELFENDSTFTGIGPHSAGSTYTVEPTYTGLGEATLVVKDSAAETVRLIAKFSVTIEAGAVVRSRAATIVDTHPDWTADTLATPPEMSISAGEVFVTFVGVVSASVKATIETRGIKT